MEFVLTNRQWDVLECVYACLVQRGYPPTVREIGQELGLRSPSTVQGHLDALERKGVLVRDVVGGPRALRLLTPAEQVSTPGEQRSGQGLERRRQPAWVEDSLPPGEQLTVDLESGTRSLDTWLTSGFGEGLKQRVLRRDGYRCRICGAQTNLHIHHIVPRRQGGSHSLLNLVTLCSACHKSVESGDAETAARQCVERLKERRRSV